ncbi:DUF5694 domain-containing protein [Ideonella sp.]|uniref:DUF5694 domain-containing protein n=1 Tax=Ideonella sp. TaxID=1929293 RepID=UPI0035B136F5
MKTDGSRTSPVSLGRRVVLGGMAAAACAASLKGRAADAGRPQLMLLGVHHFANPGLDVARQADDDVLAPARQRELASIVEALGRWQPTLVLAEEDPDHEAALNQRYQAWRDGHAELGRNETEQLGFRLRRQLGLPPLRGINWNGRPPGELKHYDYEAWATAQAQRGNSRPQQLLDARRQALQAWASEGDRVLHDRGLVAALRLHNTPARLAESHRRYFDYLELGDDAWPAGANYVGHWMTRNLRMFDNIRRAAAGQPRALVIVGAGHVPLLRRYATDSQQWVLADPLDHLPA